MLHSCSGITLTEHMARASVQQGEKQGACGPIHPHHTRRMKGRGGTRGNLPDTSKKHWVFGIFSRVSPARREFCPPASGGESGTACRRNAKNREFWTKVAAAKG